MKQRVLPITYESRFAFIDDAFINHVRVIIASNFFFEFIRIMLRNTCKSRVSVTFNVSVLTVLHCRLNEYLDLQTNQSGKTATPYLVPNEKSKRKQ